MTTIKGVNYLTDNLGRKTAVVFDLKRYKEELEDFIDILESKERLKEPSRDFFEVVDEILAQKDEV
ncbi:MAG: hypothetical protein MUF45_14110 [Spirosomaceae bacterium]|jgi:hypothetical protein|nr:hypothetical protein [Spirosomataceae bacterium]